MANLVLDFSMGVKFIYAAYEKMDETINCSAKQCHQSSSGFREFSQAFIYPKFLIHSIMTSDAGDFINHGEERSLSSSETQNFSRSLVRPQNFRNEPSTQM